MTETKAETKIEVRCSHEEKGRWKEKAASIGTSVSVLARQLLNEHAEGTERVQAILEMAPPPRPVIECSNDDMAGVETPLTGEDVLRAADGTVIPVTSDDLVADIGKIARETATAAHFAPDVDANSSVSSDLLHGIPVIIDPEMEPGTIELRNGDEVLHTIQFSDTALATDFYGAGDVVRESNDGSTVTVTPLADDTNPEVEDPLIDNSEHAVRSPHADGATLPPQEIKHDPPRHPQLEPLSDKCVNAGMHWKLAKGEKCGYCQGVMT